MSNRFCAICFAEIKECMGFVIAMDFLDHLDDKRNKVRELCGICALNFLAFDLSDGIIGQKEAIKRLLSLRGDRK